MPYTSRTVVCVGNVAGLSTGTTIDSNGSKVNTQAGYVSALELGRLTDFAAELQILAGSGGNCTVTLQDSFDDGLTWNSWVAFSVATGAAQQVVAPTRNPGAMVRTQIVVGAGGSGFSVQTRLCATERVSA